MNKSDRIPWHSLTTAQTNAVALAKARGTPGQVAELIGKIQPCCFIDDRFDSQLGIPVIIHYDIGQNRIS